jgi:hypothetical protein
MLRKILLRGGALFLSASVAIGIVISTLSPASASTRTLSAPAANTCISEMLSAITLLDDNGYGGGTTDPIQLEQYMRELAAITSGAFQAAVLQHLAEVDQACGT